MSLWKILSHLLTAKFSHKLHAPVHIMPRPILSLLIPFLSPSCQPFCLPPSCMLQPLALHVLCSSSFATTLRLTLPTTFHQLVSWAVPLGLGLSLGPFFHTSCVLPPAAL